MATPIQDTPPAELSEHADDRAHPRTATVVAVGALLGLAWAAGLRSWMVQLVDESAFTWVGTYAGLLVPAAVVGGLLGWAELLRRSGPSRALRRLHLAPLLLPVAVLALPGAIPILIETGQGSGAAMVVLLGMLAAWSVSGRHRLWVRIPAFLLGFALVPASYLGEPMRPELEVTTPLGAWAATTFASFFLLLVAACAVPRRGPEARLGPGSLIVLGALVGLAWACGLRGFMTEVAGADASMTWSGTFAYVLVPGLLAGAALGWAEHLRRTGGRRGWRWLALSPLLFAAILFSEGPLGALGIFEDGLGGGAIGVPVMAMAGGYALSGRGPLAARVACALVALVAVPVWALTATSIGGPALGLDTPHGLWVAVLFWSSLAVLALGARIPHRPATPAPAALSS